MLSLFLLVIIGCIALGLVGAVVHGLVFLLAVACVVFVADWLALWWHLRAGRRRRRRSPR